MKIHRTAVGRPTGVFQRYDYAVRGVELLCNAGLDNAGWRRPKRGQGVVLCFSTEKPRGSYSRVKYVRGPVGIGYPRSGVIKIAPLRGEPKPFNYTLPEYVVKFLKRKKLAPEFGGTRILYWWPEYIDL